MLSRDNHTDLHASLAHKYFAFAFVPLIHIILIMFHHVGSLTIINILYFRVSERDVLMSREHYHDLRDRLGISDLSTEIHLPQVFLNGQLLGVRTQSFEYI